MTEITYQQILNHARSIGLELEENTYSAVCVINKRGVSSFDLHIQIHSNNRYHRPDAVLVSGMYGKEIRNLHISYDRFLEMRYSDIESITEEFKSFSNRKNFLMKEKRDLSRALNAFSGKYYDYIR